MDTHTFQAARNPIALTADNSLEYLKEGRVDETIVAALSDLSRLQVRSLTVAWPSLSTDIRQKVVLTARGLADQQVELDFSRLFRIALNDPDSENRLIAIAGLADDDSRSCRELLLRVAVTDQSEDVRGAAIAGLTDAIDHFLDPDEDDELVAAFGAYVTRVAEQPNSPFVVRTRAIEALGIVPQTIETRALINAAWEHGDSALEVAALLAMARSRESRWLDLVRPQLDSEDAEVRYAAVRAIGNIGSTDDVEQVTKSLLDADEDVRIAAIAALGEIAGPGAVRVLRNYREHAPDGEQIAITEALDAALLGSETL